MELRTRCQQCLSESDLPMPCDIKGKRSFKLYPYGHDSFKQGREI